MSATILSRTYSDGADKSLVLANQQYSVNANISGWNSLMIGVRCAFADPGSNILSKAFYLGLHSAPNAGCVNGVLNTCSHFFGTRLFTTTWTRTVASPPYFNPAVYPYLKIGDSPTIGAAIVTSGRVPANAGTSRFAFIVYISKSGTTYSINCCYPAIAGTGIDITQNAFKSALESADHVGAKDALNLFCGTAAYVNGTTKTETVDEAANGTFDSILVAWDDSTYTSWEYSDIGFSVKS